MPRQGGTEMIIHHLRNATLVVETRGNVVLVDPMDDIVAFIENAPGRVIANHMEALDHCATTRAMLARELEKRGLLAKTAIPSDGETLSMDSV